MILKMFWEATRTLVLFYIEEQRCCVLHDAVNSYWNGKILVLIVSFLQVISTVYLQTGGIVWNSLSKRTLGLCPGSLCLWALKFETVRSAWGDVLWQTPSGRQSIPVMLPTFSFVSLSIKSREPARDESGRVYVSRPEVSNPPGSQSEKVRRRHVERRSKKKPEEAGGKKAEWPSEGYKTRDSREGRQKGKKRQRQIKEDCEACSRLVVSSLFISHYCCLNK